MGASTIMDLGIVQITSNHPEEHPRTLLLKEKSIPLCIASSTNYVLVGPPNTALDKIVVDAGGEYSNYNAWERDMSRKWRQGISRLNNEWIGLFADDVYPDEMWLENMSKFLAKKKPGQYGFRLTDYSDMRHEHGEDWMQFPNQKLMLTHRPLDYNIETLEVEDSPTAYVANCVVHRKVLDTIEPFGLYGSAPDVMWSLAIRKCGFPIGFNPGARAFHVGDRKDNR
jgi:GT2 family glycosyltransferase